MTKIPFMHKGTLATVTALNNDVAGAPLNVETWAAARAIEKRGPVDEWLAPKAAAAGAPVSLVHTALVFELSAELFAQPAGISLTKCAETLVAKDLDRLLQRAITMVRSLRRRAKSFAAMREVRPSVC